jgi:thiol-disulfide isomerase/thioredoxin
VNGNSGNDGGGRRRRPLLTPALTWLLLMTPGGTGVDAQEVALPIGTQAPAAMLQDLDGNAVQLLGLVESGKVTLLEFWAAWCEQCEALQPQIDAVEERFAGEVNVIAVAVAVSQSPRRVRRHVEEEGHEYPFLWDGDGEAVRNYRVPGTSVVVILDRDGTVAYTGSGGDQDLVSAVEKALEG